MQDLNFRVPSVHLHRKYGWDGGLVQDSSGPSSLVTIRRRSTGYTGPISKSKPLPFHAYTLDYQRNRVEHNSQYFYTSGTVRKEETSGGGLSSSAEIYPCTLDSGAAYNWSPVYNEALERLAQKVRGDLDVSVDLAQAGKTFKMLKTLTTLGGLFSAYTPKRAARLSKAEVHLGNTGRQLVRDLGSGWLTYVYGLRPLVQTIFGLADENVRTVLNETEHYRARATRLYHPRTITAGTVYGGVTFPVIDGHLKVSTTYGVNIRTDQFDIARWSSLNPISIAWELMPYSFVLDWVYNLGGYLRQLETALLYGNKFRSGYRTNLVVGSLKYEIREISASHFSHWPGSFSMVNIERVLLSSYPAPNLPSLKAELGSSRLLSAASLLAVQLNKRAPWLPQANALRRVL